MRQLHRFVDPGFPEFTRYVRDLGSELATALLRAYPTAAGFHGMPVRRVAALRYAGMGRRRTRALGKLLKFPNVATRRAAV